MLERKADSSWSASLARRNDKSFEGSEWRHLSSCARLDSRGRLSLHELWWFPANSRFLLVRFARASEWQELRGFGGTTSVELRSTGQPRAAVPTWAAVVSGEKQIPPGSLRSRVGMTRLCGWREAESRPAQIMTSPPVTPDYRSYLPNWAEFQYSRY